MRTRIVAGLFAASALIALLYLGPVWLILLVAGLAAVVGYLEFDALFFGPNKSRRVRMIALVSFTLFAMWYSPNGGFLAFWFTPIFLSCLHVIKSNHGEDFLGEVRDVSLELLGYWYVVSLFGFLTPVAKIPADGRDYLFLLFIMVFAGDTMAYFVGRFWGRRKLASAVSPKKTIEGSIGGLVGSTIGAFIWLLLAQGHRYGTPFFWKVLLAAPVIGGLGQFGDLFESLLKRSQKQKDSGSFLPGHGGMLDRMDGFALAAPAFYFYVLFVLERTP